MDESQIVDVWTLFKEYMDKKNLDVAAERFVDLLADYGVDDHTLTQVLGSDNTLDNAGRSGSLVMAAKAKRA